MSKLGAKLFIFNNRSDLVIEAHRFGASLFSHVGQSLKPAL